MHAAYVLFAVVSVGAPRAADVPREPGVYWEQSVEMQMAGGFTMPAQTAKVCMPKKQDWSEPPQQQGQEDCKLTDLKRSGQKMSWKMICSNGMSGEGEMTWAPDAYHGKSTMKTPMGEMQMKMKGKKVGGDCDANELERQMASMQEQAEQQQVQADEAMAHACEVAVQDMDAATLSSHARCKGRKGDFCERLGTREGLTLVLDQGEYARGQAAKLCGKDLDALQASVCPASAKDYAKGGRYAGEALLFMARSCPEEARPIAKRECAGRSYTDMAGAMREFCTAYAQQALARGEPLEVTPARGERKAEPSKTEAGKKILKGLFGR